MTMLKRLLSTMALLVLAACGGGGGDSGTPPFGDGGSGGGGGGGGGGGSTPTAADLVLALSASAVPSDGSQTITATATAVDANRNALAGVPVSFVADSNAIVTPAGTTTAGNGQLNAVVGIGSDRSIRTITVTATSGSLTRTAQFQVRNNVSTGAPSIALELSSASISSANPATVTATLRNAQGDGVAGQVITFAVVRGLAVTNVSTALTGTGGQAFVRLAPADSTGAGADEITASATVGGASVSSTAGFTVQATNVTIASITPATPAIGAYGQTSFTVALDGASIGAPVQVSVSSACVTAGKATLSPDRFTATTSTVTLQYRDNGCGAIQATDTLQASIDGTTQSRSTTLAIASPAVSSLAFISSSPETIFLRGSGFGESATVTFEVRDANGSALPNVDVSMRLLTLTGGVTMEGGTADVVRASDALGRVSVRVNSGTLPTPVRVAATLVASASISTVSSNLSVAVGLPSQLNFSLSQGARNIEGFNIDGTPNTYQIIAADRSGNPVPNGTSINFVTEGGQVEAIRQTTIVSGIARTVAQFVSADPRPVDGRVTITAYALGEESFIDLNGNNTYDPPGSLNLPAGPIRDAGEPFQDLGNIFKDRNFDGLFDGLVDEFVPLAINNASPCTATPAAYLPILGLDAGTPSVGGSTCDNRWSGAGQVYVRRATETVLSTSGARALWAGTSGLDATCRKIDMQVGNQPSQTAQFTQVSGDIWYGGRSGTMSFIAADANPGNLALGLLPRLNPMAAGTTITAASPTTGVTVTVGGSPVPSTTEATLASVAYSFGPTAPSSGVVLVTFTSPSGTATTYGIGIDTANPRPTACP